MLPTPTYLQFHALFVVPVVAALVLTATYRLGSRRDVLTATAILTGLALVYTTPWDGELIRRGVWWYGDGAVLVRFWSIPLGEYLFFVLQTAMVGLWVARFRVDTARSLATPVRTRLVGFAAALVVVLSGLALLRSDSGLYLGSLLVWSGPILAIQWLFGWHFLAGEWRTVAGGTLVPAAYLCGIDSIAIRLGIWTISKQYTTGYAIPLLDLPIEEAVFFFLTSLFVVQGVVLYVWLIDRWK
ncbi:lycopene cyclase [Haloarcula taiwanensis]|uniref:Lycopene cyclase n=1 Tax=Haloarcula taiwanensis TaxID=1932004 RepID=A0A2H5A0L6_9EURY|nr:MULTISPECIES: lycopene cyclase domain-containing protein [Haloarcula]AUG48282.1 lycopene cyclase [Haloarcula taiwanensis]RLM39639.1 lycopene cyclase domain-containing protein [Haloarcula sp. Atlit-120R]RLM47614.1 lycopene cyclase domain-containing protein [Haloarcula sp. Atlit-47R]RLM97172.1 lycopene cyclase domain-containing protein [Haloarcula sp. Atlit-7R]